MLTTKKTFGIMALDTTTGRTSYVLGPGLATRDKVDAMAMSLVEARMLLRDIITMVGPMNTRTSSLVQIHDLMHTTDLYKIRNDADRLIEQRIQIALASFPLTLGELRLAYNPFTSSGKIYAVKSYLDRYRKEMGDVCISFVIDVVKAESYRRERLWNLLKFYPPSSELLGDIRAAKRNGTFLWIDFVGRYRAQHDLDDRVTQLIEMLQMQLDAEDGVWNPGGPGAR